MRRAGGAPTAAQQQRTCPPQQGTRARALVSKLPGGGHGSPLPYPCLKNPTERSLAGYRPWGHRARHSLGTTPHHQAGKAPWQTEPRERRVGGRAGGQGAPWQTEPRELERRAGRGRRYLCSSPSAAGRRDGNCQDGLKHRGRHAACPLPASQGFPNAAPRQNSLLAGEDTDCQAGPTELGFPEGGPRPMYSKRYCVWHQIRQ